MTALSLVAWAIVGWWGTPWPRPWPWPPPHPDPNPWLSKVIGLVGGVAGGWAFSALFTADLGSAAGLVLTFFGAWAGSIIFNDAYGLITQGQSQTRACSTTSLHRHDRSFGREASLSRPSPHSG